MRGVEGGADPDNRLERRWDVALSFAGAQRQYIDEVAAALKARGVSCFYDADEQIELWGKYLAEELAAIYAEQAAAVVVFVSAEYVARDWTRLERRAALTRAVRERGEYVLPARFDDTPMPGLLSGMGTVDLSTRTPQEFAAMIADKLAALGIAAPTVQAGAHDSRRGAVTVEELPGSDTQIVAGQIRFRRFIPAELGSNCVLPQALDDQWVPRGQLRIMQADKASLTDLGELRHNVIRREYVRSLITAERIVINRSFLFRNPVLSAGYTADADNRNAFAELLRDGAIVLFLTKERSPLESEWAKESAAATAAAQALEPILHSVRAWCVRFSWKADNDERIDAWNGRFGERIRRAAGLDHGRFLEDVGAAGNDVSGFRRHLNLLPRLATPTGPVPITRSNLYAEYIVRDPREIEEGRYDFTSPTWFP